MQPHPPFGSPFAKPHQWELEASPLSNPHPKPQPHPRSWLLAEPSQHQQPCLKEKNYRSILQPALSLGSTRRGLGFSESPMEALECPKSTQRSSGAPKGTQRALGHTKRQTTACQAMESQTDGMRMLKKASQGVLRARKGTLRVTEWQMGSAGGTKRPKEGFGAN